MKKLLALTFVIALSVSLLCGCGDKPVLNEEALAPFVGEWDCQDSILEERGDEGYLYVGYFTLRVEEDGSFSMYDAEAGNPGISGSLYPEEDGTVQLYCDKDDFDPPFSWAGFSTQETLTYEIVEEDGNDVLYLTFTAKNGSAATLVFDRWE